jgi:hypothetical protein
MIGAVALVLCGYAAATHQLLFGIMLTLLVSPMIVIAQRRKDARMRR